MRSHPPLFAIGFSIMYVIGYAFHIPFGIYYPVKNIVAWAPQPPQFGPGMLWYGWIVAGVIVGALFCYALPKSIATRIPPAVTWLSPLGAMLFTLYKESYWFLP